MTAFVEAQQSRDGEAASISCPDPSELPLSPELSSKPRHGDRFRDTSGHSTDQSADLSSALIGTQSRDHRSFTRLYQLTSRRLFRQCLRICGDHAGAEDILAEVYISVWKRAAQWDGARGSPIAWLSAIAHNRAVDWRRKATGRMEDDVALIAEAPDPALDAEQTMLLLEHNLRLGSCVGELNMLQKEAIRAAFFGGLTYAEVARDAGVSLPTAKSWIRRGLLRLRHQFDDSDRQKRR